MAGRQPVVDLYPISDYTFSSKQPKRAKIAEKDAFNAAHLARLKLKYEKEGMQTSVYGILLVQEHNHPYVLLFQIGNDPIRLKLPGGRLKPGENEIDCLKRKLCSKLGSSSPSFNQDWQIGELVGVWWRPNFENWMYPYCPPHITKPKECKKLYFVHLSERRCFDVPTNLNLVAMPLYDLYASNDKVLDPAIYRIPDQLSRFHFNMVNQNPPNGNNGMQR